ncbi:hypothetical protein PMALA_011310 [Plasmodium malariae]|uniref:DOP1 N-terminal domain-containing protein n=1 Tax=Plasmodium malariae TaxID=5858 RepID=A0A1A8W014_PLAMA|nr:hypothetical protein PMALA_011310 [Plasmodium malariae]
MLKKSDESNRILKKKLNNDITNILLLFEKVQEWADLSNILQKLYLTIEKYETFVDISSKFLLFRRLSQCLNPLLPSGVHSKALIIYSTIFKKVEKDFFINNIHVLCSGIFEFMLHCTINLKTIYFKNIKSILNLRENVYVFAYALLLSLFNVVDSDNNILLYIYSINNYIGESIFFNNIWLLLLRHNEIRTNILNFLETSFSPQIYLLSKERIKVLLPYKDDLVLSSIIFCLNDKNILNQRITLSLLINNFPLSHVNNKSRKKIIDKNKSTDYRISTRSCPEPHQQYQKQHPEEHQNNNSSNSSKDQRAENNVSASVILSNENKSVSFQDKAYSLQLNDEYLLQDGKNKGSSERNDDNDSGVSGISGHRNDRNDDNHNNHNNNVQMHVRSNLLDEGEYDVSSSIAGGGLDERGAGDKMRILNDEQWNNLDSKVLNYEQDNVSYKNHLTFDRIDKCNNNEKFNTNIVFDDRDNMNVIEDKYDGSGGRRGNRGNVEMSSNYGGVYNYDNSDSNNRMSNSGGVSYSMGGNGTKREETYGGSKLEDGKKVRYDMDNHNDTSRGENKEEEYSNIWRNEESETSNDVLFNDISKKIITRNVIFLLQRSDIGLNRRIFKYLYLYETNDEKNFKDSINYENYKIFYETIIDMLENKFNDNHLNVSEVLYILFKNKDYL